MEKGDRVVFSNDMPGKIEKIFIGDWSGEKMAHVLFDSGTIASLYTRELKLEGDKPGHNDPNIAFALKKMEVK